jgi:tRNA-specific 2-thiouridylase
VRYHHAGSPAFLEQTGDKIQIYFTEPVHAITPGQAAVFYDGDDVLGGGWIERHIIGEMPAVAEGVVSSAALV